MQYFEMGGEFCNNVKPGWGDKKKKKGGSEKKGGGGENSPISPPLDPRLKW